MSGWTNSARARRGEPALVFRTGGHRFVISSAEIAEVRDLQAGTSGALPQWVIARGAAGMLRVVSADHIFGLRSAAQQQLLVLAHRGVAVGIERIENVTELHEIVALPRAFHGPERRWYRGLALLEGKIVPVVNGVIFAEAASVIAAQAASASAVRRPEVKAGI